MTKYTFTLIELLVTIAIVIILAGILLGGLSFASAKADNAKTRATLQQLVSALEEFRAKNGFYPPVSSDNYEVTLGLNKSDGKLVMYDGTTPWILGRNPDFNDMKKVEDIAKDTKKLQDAWENPFRYKCPGDHNKGAYDLWSNGKDGKSGTEDDITNWDNYN